MRKLVAILGIVLVAVLAPGLSSAAPFECPGTQFTGATFADSSSTSHTLWHFDPVDKGTLAVSSCSHLADGTGGSHILLYELGKKGLTKFSLGNCMAGPNTYDGKLTKGVKVGLAYHASVTTNNADVSSDVHICVVGPVTVFQH